ncbi:MAG TPA: phosphatase PAP2 family protein [Sphingomicrobium sp.]|nr:phosphatase PAP2 family protein [Sphingomicrobium sp.]
MPKSRKLNPIERADLKLADKVALNKRGLAGRWTARFAELGDQPQLIALTIGVVATGLIRRDERMARTGLRMLTAHSLATMAKLMVKDQVDRTRPGALKEKSYRMEEGESRDGRLRSMPSGHSAGAAGVAGAAMVDYPGVAAPAGLAAAAIAAAQPASRNHYITDVLVGVGVGVAVSGVARLLVPPQDKIERSR